MVVPVFAEASRPVLLDGAMATNLFADGLRPGDPPEGWTLSHPERLLTLHRRFVAAGASVLLTNSFGANALRLRAGGLEDRLVALNHAAARLAREAARDAPRPILIAGVMGPCGARPDPGAPHPAARAGFAAQAAALVAGGADLLWIETMADAAEMRIAAEAAAATGRPYAVTASFDAAGRTPGGLDAAGFAGCVAAFPVPPVAIGANCGTGPASVVAALRAMRAAAPGVTLAAKASAGLPEMRDGVLFYPVEPAGMAAYAVAAVAAGAHLVGGCCGTTPAHLAAMRAALDRRSPA